MDSLHPWGGNIPGVQSPSRHAPLDWMTGMLVAMALFAVFMLGILGVRDYLIATGMTQGRQAAEQAAKVKLDRQAFEIARLEREVAKLRQDLDTEIGVKRALAVSALRAEAARKQAVADHAAALNKLKVYEDKRRSQSSR